MRAKCEHFTIDARQLWRRLLFNHLITNVYDHLQNIGFCTAVTTCGVCRLRLT
jgi:serine/threonine-protein kinase HipA